MPVTPPQPFKICTFQNNKKVAKGTTGVHAAFRSFPTWPNFLAAAALVCLMDRETIIRESVVKNADSGR